MHSSIIYADLPQCLQDAVTVTRSLNIRYLWIDVLCIIQDDADDWRQESVKMYELFLNAFVTIGAAVSESFDQGFLHRGLPNKTIALDFQSNLRPQTTRTVFGRARS